MYTLRKARQARTYRKNAYFAQPRRAPTLKIYTLYATQVRTYRKKCTLFPPQECTYRKNAYFLRPRSTRPTSAHQDVLIRRGFAPQKNDTFEKNFKSIVFCGGTKIQNPA